MKPALAVAAVLLAATPGLAAAHEASQEQCKAMTSAAGGGPYDAQPLTALRLVGRPLDGALPPPPAGTRFIECGRDFITPTVNDVRVLLDYHVPLAITDGERVVFLEITKGQVSLRVAQGVLTPQETREVGARLDALQLAVNSGEAHGR